MHERLSVDQSSSSRTSFQHSPPHPFSDVICHSRRPLSQRITSDNSLKSKREHFKAALKIPCGLMSQPTHSPSICLRMAFIDTILSAKWRKFVSLKLLPFQSFVLRGWGTGKSLVTSLCYLIYAYMLMVTHKSFAKWYLSNVNVSHASWKAFFVSLSPPHTLVLLVI